jgi:hypothetical protein
MTRDFTLTPVALLLFAILVALLSVSVASSDEGLLMPAVDQNPYEASIKLIKLGDINGASRVFQKSVPGDWSDELEQLIRIVELRENLDREKTAIRWSILADELQDYFVSHRMWDGAVSIAKARFLRSRAVRHALDVIDLYSQAEQFDQALWYISYLEQKFFGDVESCAAIEVTKVKVYLAQGLQEHARLAVRQIKMCRIDSPETLLQLAKLQSATRQYASAVKTLVRCFELTPPSILPAYKVEAGSSEEFKPIMASSEFVAAMGTKSTVTDNCPACAKKWDSIAIIEKRQTTNYVMDGINTDDWRIK